MPTEEDVWVEAALGVRPCGVNGSDNDASIGNPFAKLVALS